MMFQNKVLGTTKIFLLITIASLSLLGGNSKFALSTEDLIPKNSNSENFSSDDLSSENSGTEGLNPEDLGVENVENLDVENLGIEDSSTGNLDSEDTSPENTNSENPCHNSANPSEDCPIPQRLRPTFSEEEDRGLSERGFQNSFLGEALSGSPDPFGGSSIGGNLDQQPNLPDVTPVDRGLDPGFDTNFDPTNVIIPSDQIDFSTCCES